MRGAGGGLVAFLASERASFVTESAYDLDSGFTKWLCKDREPSIGSDSSIRRGQEGGRRISALLYLPA